MTAYGTCFVWNPDKVQKKLNQRVLSPYKNEICVYPDDNDHVNFNEPRWIDERDGRALIVLGFAGVYVKVLFDEKILWIHDHDFENCFMECA